MLLQWYQPQIDKMGHFNHISHNEPKNGMSQFGYACHFSHSSHTFKNHYQLYCEHLATLII